MKSLHVVRTHRALLGRVAFARAAAVRPQGACVAGLGSFVLASYRRLDRSENPMHPGEGSA
jgi:hypothetical protein